MDTAIVIKRLVGQDAMSNFTMASALALKKLGKVTIFTFAYERPPVDGVEVRHMGSKNIHSLGTNLEALASTFRLARELSKYDLLLIVDPDVGPMPACRLARRYNPKLRVMWTFHGLTPVQYVSGARDRWLMRIREAAAIRSMRWADLVQVFSDFIKREISGRGVDHSKVAVMPFGIDLARMAAGRRRRVRDKYGINDGFLLLYVGRLVDFKHVDEIIESVAKLGGVSLVVVGGGPDRERLEKLAKDLHVDGRVFFAGRVPDEELPDYYAACDVFVTASRHEGFCVPIAEAMAAGRPAIVPNVAAMPQTVGDAGLIYPPGAVDELVRAINSLAGDGQRYSRLSERSKAMASSYQLETVMSKYTGLVEGLVKEGK
jgi:glycosyltransferase involved in cell wall biosynthesis